MFARVLHKSGTLLEGKTWQVNASFKITTAALRISLKKDQGSEIF